MNKTKELTVGAKEPIVSPIVLEPENALPTYGTGFVASELVSVTETINILEGEFYADDELSEYMAEFGSANLAFESKGFSDDANAAIYGAGIVDGVLEYAYDDNAPFIGFGFYRKIRDNNGTYYQGIIYPKCKATLTGDTYNTRGNSITFNSKTTTLKVYKSNNGRWKRAKRYDDESSAKNWVKSQLGFGEYYAVDITVSGDGIVSPIGPRVIASGGTLAVNVGGTPTAVYDNGADVTSSVVGGVYTLTAVAADHQIAVIYSD